MKKVLISALTALWLGACTITPLPTLTSSPTDNLKALVAWLGKQSVADLIAADTKAVTGNDADAHMCFAWAVTAVQNLPAGQSLPSAVGPIDAFEQARLVVLNGGPAPISPLLKDFNHNCAALANSTTATLVKLGVIAGGVVATGGVALPVLGGVNAAIGAAIP
jgi:hypothetical protein